jgi:hypothetical protein
MSIRTPIETTGAPPPEGPEGEGLPRWKVAAVVAIIILLAGVIVVGLVARGSGGGEDEPANVGVSPTAPATSQVLAQQPPPLLNTGNDPDWAAMVRSMLAYDAWLRRNPRPELLQQWMRPSSPLYPEGMQTLENLASGNWRYDPATCEPLSAEIVRLTSRHGTSALVFVQFPTIPACRGIDRAGNVVLDQPAQPGNSAIWTLLQDPDERWRFEKAERL